MQQPYVHKGPNRTVTSQQTALYLFNYKTDHSNYGGTLAPRATFTLDSPVKNPHTDSFQTPSKLGHPGYPNAPKI